MNSQNSLYGQGVSRDTLPVVSKKKGMKDLSFCAAHKQISRFKSHVYTERIRCGYTKGPGVKIDEREKNDR